MEGSPAKYNLFAEIVVLTHIASKEDQEKLAVTNPDWFTIKNQKLLRLWKDSPDLIGNFTKTKSLLDANGVFFSVDEITDIYTGINHHYPFEQNLQEVQDKYMQRVTEDKLDRVRQKVYSVDLKHNIGELITFCNDILPVVDRSKELNLQDDLEPINQQLLNFGNERIGLNKLVPLRKSLWIIGGDSGHQKTNQAIDILYRYYEANKGSKVVFFSREMDWQEVRDRLLAKILRIPLDDIIARKNHSLILSRIKTEFADLNENFKIIPPQEINDMTDVAKVLLKYKPDVWAIDYIQLLAQYLMIRKDASTRPKDMNTAVMEAVASCKALAQLTDSLGILLSQIRKRKDFMQVHFPRIDDLEWSGQIKHLAHNIGMCFWALNIKADAIPEAFWISWVKTRNSKKFNELLLTEPHFCTFGKYLKDTREPMKYLKY